MSQYGADGLSAEQYQTDSREPERTSWLVCGDPAMRDFSAPHRGKVAYFGIWAEDGRDEQLGDIHVWNILCDAVQRKICAKAKM